MSEKVSDRGLQDFDDYAEPAEDITYEPFRQSYRVPEWKNTSGRNRKMPVVDLGTARIQDKEIYYSKEIMQQEWERLWPKVWLVAGHLNDIPRQNSYMTISVGHESFLIIRGEGDQLRAFYNFCQHRGAQLVTKDFGNAGRFVCPFHRWEYSTDGKVKISDQETFRREALCHDLNLKPVRVDTFRGWVFINMDPNAIPLQEYIGPEVAEAMEAYDLERMVRVRDIIQQWPFNWKLAHEAFVEAYHVQATHPQLWPVVDAYHTQYDIYRNGHSRGIYQFMSPLARIASELDDEFIADEHRRYLREAGLEEKDFPKTWRDVPKAVVEAKLKRKDSPVDYSKFTEGQLTDDWGIGLFPTHEFFLQPEGVLLQEWLPHQRDPEKCWYRARVYAIPGTKELPSFMGADELRFDGEVLNPTYAEPDVADAAGPVVSQDRAILDRVQRGIHSRGFAGSVLSEQEIRIRYFFDEYYKYMRGPKS